MKPSLNYKITHFCISCDINSHKGLNHTNTNPYNSEQMFPLRKILFQGRSVMPLNRQDEDCFFKKINEMNIELHPEIPCKNSFTTVFVNLHVCPRDCKNYRTSFYFLKKKSWDNVFLNHLKMKHDFIVIVSC